MPRRDSPGNRTVQTRTITSTQVITYQYDNANRMTKAGGVNYTWDNNGNLINDGSAAYLYDRANRMISTTVGGVTRQFAYNGDGARLKQIIAGTVTTYTQDLAAPLPVVLQSQTGADATQYVYALGTRPLAQNGGSWEYLLPDALGSVRQIADANGNVTLAESYEPYGSVLTSTGTASSIFAYAGEQADTMGLIYLRARYMNPRLGLFLARDPWSGDQLRPESMNGYSYVEGNPVSRVDPSGLVWFCYPKNNGCAQWIYGALDTLSTGGALSHDFLNLFSKDDVKYWFILDDPGSGLTLPIIPYNNVLLPHVYLSDPLPPPAGHIGLFVHETVHTFRNPAERTTIFGEVEAYTVQAGILRELGYNYLVEPFMDQLIKVSVEGGQVTRSLDKLAQARCILLATFRGRPQEIVYYNVALIFNYGQGWWETCRSCSTP